MKTSNTSNHKSGRPDNGRPDNGRPDNGNDSTHDYARIARTTIEAAALALLVYHVWYAAWRLI